MGLMTPGPVVITATLIGYQFGGFVGAVAATIGIFTPIYLGVHGRLWVWLELGFEVEKQAHEGVDDREQHSG